MDLTFNAEQLQFAESIGRWAARDYDFSARQAIVGSPAGVSPAAWSALADLGTLALPVPGAHGGFDGTAVDMFIVMRELGRALVVEPYLATVMGAECLKLGGARIGHGALLERLGTGDLKLACAWGEAQARYDMRAISTTAREHGAAAGYMLDGAKTVVTHGAEADALIVSALAPEGFALFVVPISTPGVTVTAYRTLDGLRAADILFTQVAVDAEARLDGGWETLEAALDYGAALLCAEAVGAMEALFAATLDYLKTRKQFGAPLGKFQALQHRMADMYIHLEQARSMALLAAVKYAEGDAAERRRVVSAAKYRVGAAARFIGQQAVQLHGGMGVTNELPAAHYFKRLTMIDLSLGNGDHHLQRFIAQPGFAEGTTL
jgi:alkylation response protein AidB-like acyl-CoA dehydrogenase